MKIRNKCSFPIIAFGVSTGDPVRGYGTDVTINPGNEGVAAGPYIGEMGDGSCYVHIDGEIICHEGPDSEEALQVLKGQPLCLEAGTKGVTVRHHLDEPELHVSEWRFGQKEMSVADM